MKKRAARHEVVRQELEGVQLGDARRSKRAATIGEKLAKAPEASLPHAMGDRAAVEALYRHLSGEGVTAAAILEPHVAKAIRRGARLPTVFAVADTTDFVFAGDSARKGLGSIRRGDQGFLAHVTLLVAPDRTPLGVLGLETWSRVEPKGKRGLWARRNDEGRESLRWSRGMEQAAERMGAHAGNLVHVADRESDIYELMAGLVARGHRYIIRAAQDRSLIPLDPDDHHQLFAAAQSTAPTFSFEVPLSARKSAKAPGRRKRHPVRRERVAQLSFAARRVRLRRPKQRSADLVASVEVNVVHVLEVNPPEGEPPVEWLLLTSEPIETQSDVRGVVDGYRARWVIEEYFKAVKTGCAFESRQLESAKTLQALLGYTLIVAYALLLLRSLCRGGHDEGATAVLSDLQVKLLRAKLKKLSPKPSLREALLAIAGMGGHLKNNGDPGWRTLSKGWTKMLALEEGYRLALALHEM